jgi:hypothetical protein
MQSFYRVTKPFRKASARTDERLRNYIAGSTRKGAKRLVRNFRKAYKPTRFKSTRKLPKAPIGPYAGRFKRMRRKRAVIKPTYGNKDTLYGTIEGTHAVYSGYSTCGGRKHALRQFSESFFRHLLKLRKVDLKGRQDSITWTTAGPDLPRIDQLELMFRNQLGDGTTVETSSILMLWNTSASNYYSFDDVVDSMVTLLESELVDDNKFLFGFSLNRTSDGDNQESVIQSRQVCDWKLNMKVTTVIKLQNITPADDVTGTNDDDVRYSKDSILSNPLSGRSYLFGPGFPRPRSSIIGPSTYNQSLSSITDQEDGNGLITFPPANDSVYQPGGVLHVPPMGGNVFSNVVKGGGAYLSPGNFKNFSTQFSFSGNVRSFCKKVSYKRSVSTDINTSSGKRFILGQSFAFGFSPTMRTTLGETIRLAYHMDRTSRSYLSARHKVVVPRSNTSQLIPIGST